MKRTTQDYVGRPVRHPVRNSVRNPARNNGEEDVAGARRPQTPDEVASFLDARGDETDSDHSIVEEFADFLAGDSLQGDPFLPAVDPVFKERLRRRLWRLHLLTQPVGPNESH